ncbi:MAG: Flp pilus assembly complex ATPase component TadA [Deltaproteobacteria bacterium]|nr:Flp pilus assembly complex ATPase component TadA [Deltaproteobacteria bacterium]
MALQITVNASDRTEPHLFRQSLIRIGKAPGNDLLLPFPEVSRIHACIRLERAGMMIEDLRSKNGTFLNGRRLSAPGTMEPGDLVRIGRATLSMALSSEPSSTLQPPASSTPSSEPRVQEGPAEPPEVPVELRVALHRRLIEAMELRRIDLRRADQGALRARAEQALEMLIEEIRPEIPGEIPRARLLKEVLDEALGLGPLEDFLQDPAITEIMVNGRDQVYVEREGRLLLTGRRFVGDEAVLAVIERIVARVGRRIDESSPLVDARLPDGSRVHAVIPPLALRGPCLTVRKFARTPFTLPDLVAAGTLSAPAATFLRQCVRLRRSLIISGGTGSGKTTLLNVLAACIASDERIITIEDAAELQLPQAHVVSLEARPPNLEGRGAVTIRDLVRNALRMRPDRIVVGECRGGEALDMLQAMNTGHDGSLTTAHANSPRDMLLRLETMVLMSGMELPLRAVREQIASAIHIIVQQARFPSGHRRVTQITEVTGMEQEVITTQDLFRLEAEADSDGPAAGQLRPTGYVPRFYEGLRERGADLDLGLFRRGGDGG